MNSVEIRAILGISRVEFSRRYGIPIRTIEDWDAGKKHPSEWVMRLLERVVREDALVKNVVKTTKDIEK